MTLPKLSSFEKTGSSIKKYYFQQFFVEDVYNSGVLVYLSTAWLAEIFQQILGCNLLEQSGYSPSSTRSVALINLLTGATTLRCD